MVVAIYNSCYSKVKMLLALKWGRTGMKCKKLHSPQTLFSWNIVWSRGPISYFFVQRIFIIIQHVHEYIIQKYCTLIYPHTNIHIKHVKTAQFLLQLLTLINPTLWIVFLLASWDIQFLASWDIQFLTSI